MENSDDISKFRVIRKKEPYVNNNAFIQPIIGGKSKDIDTINIYENRYNSLNNHRRLSKIATERTKDFGYKNDSIHHKRNIPISTYTIEYSLQSDYDLSHEDINYIINDPHQNKSKDISYNTNKTINVSKLPNYMIPISNDYLQENGLIRDRRLIKLI